MRSHFDDPASALEAEASVVFCLDADLTITYCNPAWDRFARENGGPGLCRPGPIGRLLLDFIDGPDRDYFERLFHRLLLQSEPWERDFECCSGTTFRKFRQRVFPTRQTRGLAVINTLCIERPHDRASCPPLEEVYRDSRGMIVMCSGCRRTRRNLADEIWDWVPAFVHTIPAATSHGLCRPCWELYYRE